MPAENDDIKNEITALQNSITGLTEELIETKDRMNELEAKFDTLEDAHGTGTESGHGEQTGDKSEQYVNEPVEASKQTRDRVDENTDYEVDSNGIIIV